MDLMERMPSCPWLRRILHREGLFTSVIGLSKPYSTNWWNAITRISTA